MDAKAILDGLLDKTQQATRAGINMAEEKSLIPPPGEQRDAMIKGVGAGALAAGAVALLFGSKGTRKFVGKAARLGGTAAIGGLAYKAFADWQAGQQSAGSSSSGSPVVDDNLSAAGKSTSPSTTTSSVSRLDLSQFESRGAPIAELDSADAARRSESIIQAMISAARADGHIDDQELKLITQQIDTLGLERDVSTFLLNELNRPVDVSTIAALADTPETAAELYIASALVVDMDSPAERDYLDSLARAMQIDADLVPHLEAPLRE